LSGIFFMRQTTAHPAAISWTARPRDIGRRRMECGSGDSAGGCGSIWRREPPVQILPPTERVTRLRALFLEDQIGRDGGAGVFSLQLADQPEPPAKVLQSDRVLPLPGDRRESRPFVDPIDAVHGKLRPGAETKSQPAHILQADEKHRFAGPRCLQRSGDVFPGEVALEIEDAVLKLTHGDLMGVAIY